MFLIFCQAGFSYASVIMMGNRVIYPVEKKEKSLEFNNNGDRPALVQIWLDKGNIDSTIENTDGPFVAMPQIFRINPNQGQSVRLIYTGKDAPVDRESIFYLNFIEYPSSKKEDEGKNKLSLLIKTRLKVFYRPEKLHGNPNTTLDTLQVKKLGKSLHIHNPTAYYVSIANAVVDDGGRKVAVNGAGMVEPFSNTQWALPIQTSKHVTIEAINDYGAVIRKSFPL